MNFPLLVTETKRVGVSGREWRQLYREVQFCRYELILQGKAATQNYLKDFIILRIFLAPNCWSNPVTKYLPVPLQRSTWPLLPAISDRYRNLHARSARHRDLRRTQPDGSSA